MHETVLHFTWLQRQCVNVDVVNLSKSTIRQGFLPASSLSAQHRRHRSMQVLKEEENVLKTICGSRKSHYMYRSNKKRNLRIRRFNDAEEVP